MNKLDKQYTDLLQDILDNGVKKQDRTGTGTISVFGRQIRHNMKDGFPLLTTKKLHWKSIVTELLWFLRGDTDIRFLWKNNCNIWDGDWYKNYKKSCSEPYGLEEMKKFALVGDKSFHDSIWDLGPIYGKQWRGWVSSKAVEFDEVTFVPTKYEDIRVNDQIQNLINDLKTNPDSRRLIVSAWNVGELDQCVLPPCHYGFQVYTRELNFEERLKIANMEKPSTDNMMVFLDYISVLDEKNIPKRAISLMWNQRSVDTFLGLPFNIASYGLLLEIIAKAVNMVPDQLIGNLGDVHLYSNHIEQAKEQIGRKLIIEERVRWAYDRKLIDYVTMVESEELDRLNVPTHTRQPYSLPTLKIENEVKWVEGDCLPYYSPSNFSVENYQSHPTIKAPLSN